MKHKIEIRVAQKHRTPTYVQDECTIWTTWDPRLVVKHPGVRFRCLERCAARRNFFVPTTAHFPTRHRASTKGCCGCCGSAGCVLSPSTGSPPPYCCTVLAIRGSGGRRGVVPPTLCKVITHKNKHKNKHANESSMRRRRGRRKE